MKWSSGNLSQLEGEKHIVWIWIVFELESYDELEQKLLKHEKL